MTGTSKILSCFLLLLFCIQDLVWGQAGIPDDLPISDDVRKYLESLPPKQLAEILKVYAQAVAGQVAASPELIEELELFWSYERSPPVYPSPEMKGLGNWSEAYDQARAIVSKMTNEEKENITIGESISSNGCGGSVPAVPRLGFPGICLSDGPNGLHDVDAVNGYPSAITIGATWNKELAFLRGRELGAEAKRKGINSLLAPTLGPLGRTVLGGRNWESFSVDPYLCGSLAARTVTGIQENAIATAKHLIANEQETNRSPTMFGFGNASVSSNIDDKTMHEYYLWPFQDVVKAGVGSVMCSYQRINGSHGCQNSFTQNGLLKTELGFQGYVVSDWDAVHTGIASANAGLDLVMPSQQLWTGHIATSVSNGSMTQARLDDMATRILATYLRFGNFQPATGMPQAIGVPHKVVSTIAPEAKPILLQGAVEGVVLVKNFNKTLPLKKPKILSLFGYDAHAPLQNSPGGPNSKYGFGYASVNKSDAEVQGLFIGVGQLPQAAILGTLVSGGGSASISPAYIDAPYDAFQRRAREDGTFLVWDFQSQDPLLGNGASDACIVFINEFSSEGSDRSGLADPYSDQIVENVAGKCSNTIVAIHNAGTRLVDQWIDHPNVTAVIFAHLPGQDSGQALVEIMYGDQAPSGRLPYTVAKNESDYGELLMPTLPDNASNYYTQANFTEGSYIDYRRFDSLNITPRFEFGFGLTYTTFKYSGLNVTRSTASTEVLPPPGPILEGGLASLWEVVLHVNVSVTNTGGKFAPEVVQLYIGIPGAPVKQLRGFEKISLQPEEQKMAVFELTRRDLSVWDTVQQSWILQQGNYQIYVGASSRDIRLTESLRF